MFGPSGLNILLEISAVQTVNIAFSYRSYLDHFALISSALRKSKDGKPYVKRKPLMLHCFVSLFSLTSYKKKHLLQEDNVIV